MRKSTIKNLVLEQIKVNDPPECLAELMGCAIETTAEGIAVDLHSDCWRGWVSRWRQRQEAKAETQTEAPAVEPAKPATVRHKKPCNCGRGGRQQNSRNAT